MITPVKIQAVRSTRIDSYDRPNMLKKHLRYVDSIKYHQGISSKIRNCAYTDLLISEVSFGYRSQDIQKMIIQVKAMGDVSVSVHAKNLIIIALRTT